MENDTRCEYECTLRTESEMMILLVNYMRFSHYLNVFKR